MPAPTDLNLIRALRPEVGEGKMAFILSAPMEYEGRRYAAGQQLVLDLTPSQVTNQTQELDSYLGGYQPYGFAADLVCPVVLVDEQAGTRRDLALANAFERVDTRSGSKGATRQVDLGSGTVAWRVHPYALATFLPWMTENDATKKWNIRASAGEMIRWKLALDRECRVWDFASTLTNWASTNRTTLLTNFKWDNGSTKSPRADIQARLDATAQPVTDIFMNPLVAFHLLSDSDMRAYMRQWMGDSAPSAGMAQAAQYQERGVQTFQITGFPPMHIVPSKVYNPNTGALESILGDDVVLTSNPGGLIVDGHTVSSLMTYRHKGRSGSGVVTNEYQPQGMGGINGGTMFETGFDEQIFMGSNIAGGLIKDVLS